MTTPSLSNTEFIKKLREITLANIRDENFGVNELAKSTGLTYYDLNRRLRMIIKQTTSQFINEIRLKRAKEILEQEEITASEVAYRVGFGSPAYFSRCFHEHFGFPPGEIKKRGLNDQIENHNVLPVTSKIEEDTPLNLKEQQPGNKKLSRKGIVFTSAGILILAIASFLYFSPLFDNSAQKLNPEEKSIAVLPFRNLGNNEDNQWFADGIVDDIINRMYEIKQLRVVSRTSVEQFRNSNLSAPEIAKKLGVNFLLEGSALQSGGKVRVIVKLVDAINDKLIFSEQYDGDQEDIFKIQSDIAKQVAGELQAALTPNEIMAIEKKPARNEEAFKYYLMGRDAINKKIGDESTIWKDLNKALEYYQKSVSIDPSFPLAYSGLAETYYWIGYWKSMPRDLGFSLAKENAQKALHLDKNIADAHSVLGRVYTYGERKWEKAREEFLLATKENPSDPFAHAYYSELLNILGEDAAAREQINLALQFDPTMRFFYQQSVTYYFNEGKLKECLEEIQKVEEFQKDLRGVYIWTKCYAYDRLNEDSIAVEILKKILQTEVPDADYAYRLDSIYRKDGSTGIYKFMLNYLKQDPDYPQYYLAQVYGRLGMKKEAIDCLHKSFEKKEIRLPQMNNDPRCVYIRKEPGFREVIDKLGLGPYFNPDKDFSPVAD